MRRLFGILGLMLLVASGVTWWIQPSRQSDVPILYWTTSPYGIREQQVEGFQEWLAANGYPPVDIRLDNSNNDISKKLIQGISGVGGDVIDTYADQLYMLQATGMIQDVTEPAEDYGFTPEATFPELHSDLVIDGQQWGFPANTGTNLYWVNLDTMAEAGLETPPQKWDVETFEEWGTRYVEARNPEGERQLYYFANTVDLIELLQSTGLSQFNETLTACRLNDPRYVMVLNRIWKWIHELHLIPTREEESTFAVEGAGGTKLGARMALFARGNYAMLYLGRFAIIRLREYGDPEYSASFMPHFEYPNARMGGGAVAVYRNSTKKEHAYRLLAYLASDAHNQLVVESGDGLPVNPEFLEKEAFLRPEGRENEWPAHRAFADSALHYGIARVRSPFVESTVMGRLQQDFYQSFLAGLLTAEEAAARTEKRVNQEIQRKLEDQPHLVSEYERRLDIQQQINQRKAQGKPIPEEWIFNPFYLKYYRDTQQLIPKTKKISHVP